MWSRTCQRPSGPRRRSDTHTTRNRAHLQHRLSAPCSGWPRVSAGSSTHREDREARGVVSRLNSRRAFRRDTAYGNPRHSVAACQSTRHRPGRCPRLACTHAGRLSRTCRQRRFQDGQPACECFRERCRPDLALGIQARLQGNNRVQGRIPARPDTLNRWGNHAMYATHTGVSRRSRR